MTDCRFLGDPPFPGAVAEQCYTRTIDAMMPDQATEFLGRIRRMRRNDISFFVNRQPMAVRRWRVIADLRNKYTDVKQEKRHGS